MRPLLTSLSLMTSPGVESRSNAMMAFMSVTFSNVASTPVTEQWQVAQFEREIADKVGVRYLLAGSLVRLDQQPHGAQRPPTAQRIVTRWT